MSIDVKKVSELAYLELSPEEEILMQKKLEQVLNHFQSLVQVATDQVEPLVTPVEMVFHYREDEVKSTLSQEEALLNAPDKQGFLFKVPPVIEK